MSTIISSVIHESALADSTLIQSRLLHSQAAVTYLFPLAAALALCALLWQDAPRLRLLGWCAAILALSAARYLLLWRAGAVNSAAQARARINAFAAGAFLSGTAWGAAPLLLIQRDPAAVVEFTLFNCLALLVICGLTAGAALAYAASLRVLFCFSAPALLPPGLFLIALGDRFNSALGGFVLLYFLFVALAAARMHFQLCQFMRVEQERDALIDAINRARARMQVGRAAAPG